LQRLPFPRQYLYYGGGAAALLIVALAIWSLFSGDGSSAVPPPPGPAVVDQQTSPVPETPPAPPPPAPPPPTHPPPTSPAEVTVGPTGNFATINEALAYVQDNPPLSPDEPRVIKVAAGQTYAERLTIENWNFGQLTIVADGEGRATLKPPGTEPAITIARSSRVRIERLAVQASDKPIAVRLSGILAGVVLQNLEITGFREVGVLGDEARALNNGARLELRDLLLDSARSEAVGVRFTMPVTGGFGSGGVEFITFANLRAIGPMDVGLQLSGDVRQVAIQKCRFFNLKTGIALELSGTDLEATLIENNTFHRAARGIALSAVPANVKGFVVQKNLFSELSGPEVDLPGAADAPRPTLSQGGQAPHNWTSRTAQAVETLAWNLFANAGKTEIGAVEYVSDDPSKPDFLKPKRSDLRVPGAPGADKYIGAVGP